MKPLDLIKQSVSLSLSIDDYLSNVTIFNQAYLHGPSIEQFYRFDWWNQISQTALAMI